MTTLVQDMFSSFTTVISSMAGGMKNAFMNLLYVDPEASTLVISPLVQFIFITGGVVLATGILYTIFKIVRFRRHGN